VDLAATQAFFWVGQVAHPFAVAGLESKPSGLEGLSYSDVEGVELGRTGSSKIEKGRDRQETLAGWMTS
jgi:hypothetical protein